MTTALAEKGWEKTLSGIYALKGVPKKGYIVSTDYRKYRASDDRQLVTAGPLPWLRPGRADVSLKQVVETLEDTQSISQESE